MWKDVMILLLFVGLILLWFAPQLFKDDGDDGMSNASYELHNVSLAVTSLQAEPDNPVRDLIADKRLACIEGGCVICVDEFDKGRYTNQIARLITLSGSPGKGSNQVKPLDYYLNTNYLKNYYCVHPDGTVDGFLEDGTRIEP